MVLLDTARFPAVFFGAIRIGAVPVPVNTLLTSEDYDYLLRDSRARVLVVSAALLDRVAPVLAGQPFLEHVIVDGAAPAGFHDLGALLDRAGPTLEAAPTTSDDVAFWLYTSGSTGKFKGAVHLQADLVHTAELYAVGVLGIREDDRVFSAAKLFFAYGLGNAMTFPLRVGATAVLMAERPTPAAVRRRFVERDPTVFCGVPTLFASLLADVSHPGERPGAPSDEALVGPSLRVSTSAGEALPRDIGERWRARTGTDILDGIGSTEMLHIFLSNRPGDVRYGTTGKVVPGYDVKILGEDGSPLPDGSVGDLWVRGPSSAVCYWNKRELSRATFQGAWTKTGDHYLRDDEGYHVYQGRSDDMLKVGGIYVSPFEVEAALVSHDRVLEAAVVGCTDEHGLVKPKALVVLKEVEHASAALADELRAHVKAMLAPYKYPRWVEFVRELPKTATGKIQRFKLRQRG